MSDCKGMMLTGCRDGSHGWGCPLADPVADVSRAAASAGTHSGGGAIDVSAKPEYVCEHEGCDRPAYRPKVRGQLLCAIHSVKIEIGGRRSGKTYRMEQTKAVMEMTCGETIGIYGEQPGIKQSGHRVWVCPICYSGDGGWQVEAWNGLFPSLIDRAIQDVAMEHLLEMWNTHGEWCLDLLEMTKEVDRG